MYSGGSVGKTRRWDSTAPIINQPRPACHGISGRISEFAHQVEGISFSLFGDSNDDDDEDNDDDDDDKDGVLLW